MTTLTQLFFSREKFAKKKRIEGGGGGQRRHSFRRQKGKKREKTLSPLSLSLLSLMSKTHQVISSSSSSFHHHRTYYALFFFRTKTTRTREKKRLRDASKRALARLVPPNPTRDDSVDVRETSKNTSVPLLDLQFFLEQRLHPPTRKRDAIAHPIEHRRATRHRRQEKREIFADVSTNARDRVSRES